MFSHLIPAEGLTRIERGRKRQGLVPDFRLEIPSSTEGTKLQLAELKMICCCATWYPSSSGVNVRGTDKRAEKLHGEYHKKAKDIDRNIIKIQNGGRGPVEKKLDEYGKIIGLCFGAWGEASEDVHTLIHTLAKSRIASQNLRHGFRAEAAELGIITGQIRRRISLVAIKSQVECLLSKLHQVGPGGRTLAKK